MNLAHHLIVGGPLKTNEVIDANPRQMQCRRGRNNVRQEPRLNLEPADLFEIGVRFDRPEMENLVETLAETCRFHVIDDEAHGPPRQSACSRKRRAVSLTRKRFAKAAII